MTAPPVVFTAGGVMISGLSLTIRDKCPTPRELFWRVARLPSTNRTQGEIRRNRAFILRCTNHWRYCYFHHTFVQLFVRIPNPFSLFYAAQILTSHIITKSFIQLTYTVALGEHALCLLAQAGCAGGITVKQGCLKLCQQTL